MTVVGSDFEEWRKGDKLHVPQDPNEWDELIINFFLSIHKIIAKENHSKKFDGKRQIIDILNLAAMAEGVNLEFMEEDGEWGLMDTGYKLNDLLRLKDVQYRFSRIYRHHAKDYSYDSKEDIKELMGGYR